MAETRRKFDQDFKEGAVRLVRETGKPIAQVARDLGINEGTLGNWVNADKRRRGDGNGALSEDDTSIPVLEMIRKMPAIKGYSIRRVAGDADRRKIAVEYVTKALASGALKPVIDRIFEFDEMVEVHRYLENSGQFGKIVVTV